MIRLHFRLQVKGGLRSMVVELLPNEEALVRELCRRLKQREARRILDVGCGTGKLALFIAEQMHLEEECVDRRLLPERNICSCEGIASKRACGWCKRGGKPRNRLRKARRMHSKRAELREMP